MIGTFEKFELRFGSFGEQHTTIDGVTYLTWFDLVDRNLKALEAGAKVEYEVRSGPTVLCNMPRVTSLMPSAKLLQAVRGAEVVA
jgi:hypothetical protein